jgi:hypothetical protein
MFAPPRQSDATTDTSGLRSQISRVSGTLQTAASGLFGDRMKSIGKFDVFLADSRETETLSSASGKIALYGGIAGLSPTDDWLAFVIAREMGHVLAGHHDDNSAASILTSIIMNILLPGSSLLKSALSLAGSQTAAAAGAERQVREADEIAVRLLETSGFRMRDLALSLATGPSDERLGSGGWAQAFRKSAADIMGRARATPVVAQPSVPEMALAALTAPVEVAAATEAAPAAPPPQQVVAPALRVSAPAFSPMPLAELPVSRARPSGVAGQLLLGGNTVPARRID